MSSPRTRKKSALDIIEKFVNEKIITDKLEDIVGERFGRYSKYIIQDRALPDVRDGLKPVQRRILFAMYRLGMFSNKPFKKSARIVGEVIGKFHPHGDTSVYDAMVRMSQNFKMLLPLIDMHGNNGSIEGDGAAAMRYTEARLSKVAEYLLQDINKKTVGFVPNFDDEEYEPTVLPAKYPNLLVNGATGISAGYATEIPPHNIDEIINAVIYRINHPKCTLKDLMEIVQGPDFPTGGIVQGIESIEQAYRTGRGKVIVKSKTEIVEGDNVNQIVITEIPYDVNKAQLVKRMSDIYDQKGVDGVLAIRDESDRQGLRIVVDVRKDANCEFIRNFFFKSTDLQVNFNFNMVAISNKRPVMLGLVDFLDAYIAHQKEVVTNRSNFELKSAKKRLHIVEGLISMTSILDAVIQTIRNSLNKKDAKENLIATYSFTEEQAEAIVMLQLYRLTNTDIVALRNEQNALSDLIKHLEDILSNESALMDTIKKELIKTLRELSQPRRTVIEHKVDEVQVDVKELIAKEDAVVILSHDGYIKRMTPKNYNTDEETRLKENDIVMATYNVTTTDTLLLFTNAGNYIYLPISNIPEAKHREFGRNVSTLVTFADNEKIIFGLPVSDFEADKYLLFTTKQGLTKRTHIRDLMATRYSKALKATKIRDDDELVSVDVCEGENTEVVMVTKQGFMNRYNASEISLFAPASFGVKAIEMKTRADDEVVSGHYVDTKDLIILLNNKGQIKTMRPIDIQKGKKNHVGRQYITSAKSNPSHLIDFAVLHKNNTTGKTFIEGTEGITEFNIDDAKPTNKKPTTIAGNYGKARTIIISRNDGDLE